jgi:hypothetical protein
VSILNTIFMDESGYAGQDLLNTEQPVFALATLNCTEERCQELKKTFFKEVKADELKYSSMKKLVKQQRMILKFMNELSRTPELIKVNLVHKKYMLTGKLVDFVVEPGLKTQGINLYEKDPLCQGVKAQEYGEEHESVSGGWFTLNQVHASIPRRSPVSSRFAFLDTVSLAWSAVGTPD